MIPTISMMGSGTPILLSKGRYMRLPVDRRLSKSETTKANQRLEIEAITYQTRLLELGKQRAIDESLIGKEMPRDSYVLYDNDELICPMVRGEKND